METIREQLLAAAVKLLGEEGAAALTVRRIAEAAGVSTMAVYSRYGGMGALLDAVYVKGFDLLEEALRGVEAPSGPEELEQLGLAYRRFALSNPALFALMFERPLPGFDPSPAVRSETLEATFGLLEAAVVRAQDAGYVPAGDPRRIGYLIWVGVHGSSALEATYTSRSPLDEWFLGSDAEGAEAVRSIVRITVAGLEETGP